MNNGSHNDNREVSPLGSSTFHRLRNKIKAENNIKTIEISLRKFQMYNSKAYWPLGKTKEKKRKRKENQVNI